MRGRRSGSTVRNNIASILLYMGESYGYDIYKTYTKVFGKVHIRSIYYNLKKGALDGEFVVHGVRKERGDYTWGSESERVYYALGPNANAKSLSDKEIRKIV